MRYLTFLICLLITSAYGLDKSQYYNVDPKIREWFESVRSPHGIPCCSVSDGHYTTWRKSEKEGFQYEVPIEGEWQVVPPEAIIYNSKNPTGESIVWYVRQGTKSYYIRCFVLGNAA